MDVVQFDEALLSGKPKQLVFLTGLDLVNNNGHHEAFKLFSNFSDERFPVHFKILNGDVDLSPPQKDIFAIKGPKGILKSTWVQKYTERKPAVIVVFIDLNWNHPSWTEKKTECESKIYSLRQSIGEQSATRLALVLLQSKPSSEDPLSTERSAELCSQCRITQKQLFTLCLSNQEQAKSSAVRLVQAFHEMCQQFYQQTIRAVRARAIPNNYPNLLIRQQFKLAFLSELRMDTHTALRHYRQAYNQITSYEITDSDAYEIRSVAGLLNFKICQLSFAHSTALEALAQYRKFITTFYTKSECQYPTETLASIEFSLWKAKQSVWFAELFESAIGRGLVGISTQHPGLHFHEAANFYIDANQQITVMKANPQANTVYPHVDPLIIPANPLKKVTLYYGQRPWRVPFENGNLADADTERNARVALEIKCAPDYPRVMNLLNLALTNYKTYRCARFQRQVMIQMADEYLLLRESANAVNMLNRIVLDYRRCNHLDLLHPVLLRVLSTAYCTYNLTDYMTALIQLMNPKLYENEALLPENVPAETYALFFAQHFLEICEGRDTPQPVLALTMILTEKETSDSAAEWKRRLEEPVFFLIPMNELGAFVEVSACFLTCNRPVAAESPLIIQVSFLSKSTSPVRFGRLHLTVGKFGQAKEKKESESEEPPLWEFEEKDVTLAPKTVTSRCFTFAPRLSEIGLELTIKSISLELGNMTMCGKLEWEAPFNRRFLDFRPIGMDVITIMPPTSQVSVTLMNKEPKSLLGEISDLDLELCNGEGSAIENIRIECLGNTDGRERTATQNIRFLNSEHKLNPTFTQELKRLEPGQKARILVRYCCHTTGDIQISAEVRYNIGGVEKIKVAVFDVTSKQPFMVRPSVLSVNGEPTNWIVNGDESILRAEVEATAALSVQSIKWTLNKELLPLCDASEEFGEEEGHLDAGEVLSPCVIVKPNSSLSSANCELGQLVITWKRPQSSQGLGASVRSVLDLGSVAVEQVPLIVTSHISESPCVVRSPIPIVFTLKNTSNELLDLRLTLDLSDLFMFAGHKEISVRLLPGDSYDSKVTLLALSAGRLPFPRLVIECPQVQIDKRSFGSVPSSLFVLPLVKN
uniref:Foie-gras_1 domain-containing protein n=1 Tax=Steinernema glaseri TaxID=37863 RepID=A0A1I7YMA3_9BILA